MSKKSEAEKAAEEYFLSMMEDIPGNIHEVPPKTLHIPIKEMPPLIRNAFLAGVQWAAPKFIKCSERLPEVDGEYWTFSTYTNGVYTETFEDGCWWSRDCYDIKQESLGVTHWANIIVPAAPKEEK